MKWAFTTDFQPYAHLPSFCNGSTTFYLLKWYVEQVMTLYSFINEKNKKSKPFTVRREDNIFMEAATHSSAHPFN